MLWVVKFLAEREVERNLTKGCEKMSGELTFGVILGLGAAGVIWLASRLGEQLLVGVIYRSFKIDKIEKFVIEFIESDYQLVVEVTVGVVSFFGSSFVLYYFCHEMLHTILDWLCLVFFIFFLTWFMFVLLMIICSSVYLIFNKY